LRLIAFFTIPASVGLILLREPVIALLFQRGLFTAVDTAQTADALLWYTAGLWAFSALKVVTQAFFSLKDTKTPVWFSVVAVLLNLGAGLALMGPMAQGGLALATSLAAAGNVIGLFIVLVKRLGNFPLRELAYSLLRTTAAAGVMGVFLLYCRTLGNWTLGLTMTNGFILAAALFGGLAVFFAAAYVLKCRELQAMPEMIRRTRNE
jgi:putative peptidoglycan lipid II flippase